MNPRPGRTPRFPFERADLRERRVWSQLHQRRRVFDLGERA
jgi:hypothetical protein